MLRTLIVKVARSLARQGVFGTLQHAVRAAGRMLLEWTPSARRDRHRQEAAEREFDRAHNIDTSGLIDLMALEIGSVNWKYGSRYQGIAPRSFREMVEGVGIHYEDFTFIDLGSGKGRALLLASEFGFRRILGIEFSAKLVDISRRNIRCFRSGNQRCRDIAVICEDATTFHLPDESTVLFLYNPFDHHVMGRVIENVCRSMEGSAHEVIVLYANPVNGELWDKSGVFRKTKSTGSYAVWRNIFWTSSVSG